MEIEPDSSRLGAAFRVTIVTAFMHALFPVGLALFFLYGAPRFEKGYMDVGLPLPAATALVFDLAQWVRINLSYVAVVAALLLGIDAVVFLALRRSCGAAGGSIWSGAILAGEVGFTILCVVCALLPAW